ncbi:hypothetical protein H0H93_013767, partial [Arthromyces matolae]
YPRSPGLLHVRTQSPRTSHNRIHLLRRNHIHHHSSRTRNGLRISPKTIKHPITSDPNGSIANGSP